MPEPEKPVPATATELMVSAAVPVEDSVSACVDGEPSVTLPKDMLVALTLMDELAAFNCSANVSDTLPEVAVRVTDWALLTAATVAENAALADPALTVTEAGTVTELLLLARVTFTPPVGATPLRVTVQESVPEPVNEEELHETAVSATVPVPLRLTTVEAPVLELLAKVSVPLTAPAVVGSN
jgi:hypothetical protein